MAKTIKKHFVLDIDDTLTDSYEFNQQMFVDTFIPHLDLTNLETKKFVRDVHYHGRGSSMRAQFEAVIKHFSLNLDAHELVKQNEALHIENVDKIRVFDAVEDLIKHITDSGRKVYICTNRQTESATKIIKNNNLEKYFTEVISCIDDGHEKPDPHCLTDLVQRSGDSKDTFIYFGDSKTDYQFATNAGVDCIIVDHYLNQKKFYKMLMESFI